MQIASSLIESMSDRARPRHLAVGEVLVEQGDDADDVYVVVAGRLEALNATPQGPVVVGTLQAGQVVGEVSVVAGGKRTATLRAVEPTDVLALSRTDFEWWLTEHPEMADAVSVQARERIDRGHVASMVAEMVGDAEAELIQDILDRVEWRRLESGELLFREGDVSDAAYFIVGGRLRVLTTEPDGSLKPLAELGRGEVVGELGLLDGAPRSATVQAARDSTLAVFSTATFEELVTRSPALMLHVARGILTRLRRTPRRLVGRAAAVTVAVSAPIEARPIIDAMVAEIGRFGSVRHLSSDIVDRFLNRPGIAHASADNVGVPRLSEFMHEADVGNDHVVLEADRELTGWTRRALRQADRVVIVMSARPDRDERARIAAMLASLEGLEHVARMAAIVHPAGTPHPSGTAAIIDEFGFGEVVHLRAGSAADRARLARLASGNGIGLVLSGGGARGFAHIGVYRALAELGIPIDALAGCSMGAPLGAGAALLVSPEESVAVAQRLFHRLLDYTLPVVSLVKAGRITENIDGLLHGLDIEDLWLPYVCVSTNLTQSRLEVHRRGDAATAVRASVAIPGVLPPVPYHGDLLVDGGVLNNLPFETLRDDGRIDTVIAVDVAPAVGPRARADYGLSVSGFSALAAQLRRKSPYPSVSAVLLRSMLTGAVLHQQTALRGDAVDLYLHLPLPGVGLLEFERVAEIADTGYLAAIDQIREWVAARPHLVAAP